MCQLSECAGAKINSSVTRLSQEEVAPGSEHRHVGECQWNQRDGEERKIVHEEEVMQEHLREEGVHEEGGHQSDPVEEQVGKQVLEARHRHEREDQVEDPM